MNVFFIFTMKESSGLICLQVDDFKGAGTKWFKTKIMDAIERKFKISKRETNEFKYTGVDVVQKNDGAIVISQESYKKTLEPIDVDTKTDNDKPLDKEKFKKFRGLTGKISWLSDCTRPNLAYECLKMSFYNRDAKINDFKNMNKLVKGAQEHDTEVNTPG